MAFVNPWSIPFAEEVEPLSTHKVDTPGLSLSWEMTLIVSIAFGSLLFVIIIAVIISCIYVWYNKKQDMDIMEDNSTRRNRLRRLNSIHPSREISIAELAYLHNKSRAEYASRQRSSALPGYLDSEESTLNQEFRENVNNRSTSPPPPYDQNQEGSDSIASVPCESDLTPLPTRLSRVSAPKTSTRPNLSSSASTRNNSRNQRSDTKTEDKDNDDIISRTKSKKNQKAAHIINVEDPDRLRHKKIADQLKHEKETGERRRRQSAAEADFGHGYGREENKTERNKTQLYQDNNNRYDESTYRHSRITYRSPTREITHNSQLTVEK
ncbi:hypothetical protein LOTGIDRAFT_170323 [Lottia gigantea]|uniref:Uncharacterized protein n=1 Tax=Lottia gigantea TaxID=225164 RepID=V4B1G3_LOTGI|nr:hypothetical protein LOTGIDRAFT_170323 [Lottia gigantea]ESO82049.1 hypothetical protein LOTGIDRAFT_170323 [Lottia gigantea]